MNPMDQSRRRRFRPLGGRGCLLLLGVLPLALAGCGSDFGARRQNDPLLGPTSGPTPAAPPSAAGSSTAQTTAAEPAPPLPAAYSAVGPAAVAGGEAATPEPGRNLRIGEPAATGTPTGNTAVRGAAPGVTVGNPEPAANGSTSRLSPVPSAGAPLQPVSAPPSTPVPAGSGAANIRTFEEAQQYLEQHRVTRQRLDKVENGWWKFDCSVPNPTNPQLNRTYETSQPFPDPLSAIRAVITKMEEASH